MLLALQPADGHHHRSGSRTSSASKPKLAEANIARAQGGLELLRHHRGLPRRATRCRRRSSSRASTATSAATPRSPWASWPPPAAAGLPLFLGAYPITPGLRHPARAVDATRSSASSPSRPRTRSRPSARRSAPSFGGALGVTTTSGPGMALKTRGDRPRDRRPSCRCHLRHPARRPVDRPADQDRAGRPAAGDVRPQQRGAAAGDRGRVARPTASDVALEASRIAVKYMMPVIAALRRLHRQRRRAVEAARASRTCPTSAIEFRTDPEGFMPYQRDPETLARPVGHPRHARPRAPHRRPREAGRHRQRQLRAAQPRAHGPPARRQGGGASPTTSPTSSAGGDPEAATCWWWAGARPTAPSPAPSTSARKRGCGVGHVHLRHLNPFPKNLGEVLTRFEQRARPRDEPGPARVPAPRHTT